MQYERGWSLDPPVNCILLQQVVVLKMLLYPTIPFVFVICVSVACEEVSVVVAAVVA